MEKIDFRLRANFAGYEVILAPSNQHNRQKLQEAYAELSDMQDAKNWYDEQVEKVENDDRLKDSTKEKKIKELDKEYVEKVKQYAGKLPDHRKKVIGIMVDEWKGKKPDEQFYSNEYFDDFALNRFLAFFLNPKGLTPSEAQSNGSGS